MRGPNPEGYDRAMKGGGPWWMLPSPKVKGNWYLGTGTKHVDNSRVVADDERLAKRIMDMLNATEHLPKERNNEVKG